jgi:hypothetical protein
VPCDPDIGPVCGSPDLCIEVYPGVSTGLCLQTCQAAIDCSHLGGAAQPPLCVEGFCLIPCDADGGPADQCPAETGCAVELGDGGFYCGPI